MRRIVAFQEASPRIGVATVNGRAYYRISNLLKQIGIPFSDIIFSRDVIFNDDSHAFSSVAAVEREFKVVITTKNERPSLNLGNMVCEEDLGEDAGVAKERLMTILYPPKPDDKFVVGIDPGERTGVAAFINHREIESSVFSTIETALARVAVLLKNAPDVKKTVKIGCGNLSLARRIAKRLDIQLAGAAEISLVNENGTSALRRKGKFLEGTRDQRAAKLIAFRGGENLGWKLPKT